jgi:two-component system heavy metal sensor histidine kinase CusS
VRRPRSIALRLTIWYAATASILVAIVVIAQYRRLAAELDTEDDELLHATLVAAQASDLTALMVRSHRPPGPVIRVLDQECRVLAGDVGGLLPPPRCDASAASGGRGWTAPGGSRWRILLERASPAPGGAVPPRAVWVEALMDRARGSEVLAGHRAMLARVLPATLLLTSVLGYWLVMRGLAPLDELSIALTRIDARSLDHTLDVTDAPTEVRILVSAFDGVRERLNAAFASLTQFSTELAHELRTPLHVVRQQTEVALARARTPDEYREVLLSSLEELDRLHRMVDDILFLARAEDPRSHISRTEMSVGAELADVADYLEPLAVDRGVTLASEDTVDLRLSADRMLLRRALVNLVSNAIRHTPPGGRVTLGAASRDGLLAIQVRDTGVGIPPSALPHVFDRYYRVPGVGEKISDGTGLGLAIVRGILSLHGGTATVTSAPGEGTLVTLVFPLRLPDRNARST